MKRFIFLHALEIYTILAITFILIALVAGDLSFVQKMALIYGAIFILHEWEEGRYPGDLTELIAERILHRDLTEEAKKGNRVPAGILLLGLLIVPFFFDSSPIPILVAASLGFLEGFAHIMFIIVLELKKPYSPGMITGELEMLISIALFIYLGRTGFASAPDYILGFIIMFACYFLLQRSIFAIIGIPYSEMPKIVKARITTLRAKKRGLDQSV